MAIRREELEVGGTAYYKTGQSKILVTVVGTPNRNGVTIKFRNGRQETVQFHRLEPDNEFLQQREVRELNKRQRIASEREPAPLSHKITIPARIVDVVEKACEPRPAPQLQLVPAPEALFEPDTLETSRRFQELVRWLMLVRHDNKRGATTRLKAELGLSNLSQILSGTHRISLTNAVRAAGRVGFDERYFRLAEYIPPDRYNPAPAAPAESAQTQHEPPPEPAPQPTTIQAAPASAIDALREEVRVWRELSPIARVRQRLAENLVAMTMLEKQLDERRRTQDELSSMLADLEGERPFDEAAAE